jgi:hypothetical protein
VRAGFTFLFRVSDDCIDAHQHERSAAQDSEYVVPAADAVRHVCAIH